MYERKEPYLEQTIPKDEIASTLELLENAVIALLLQGFSHDEAFAIVTENWEPTKNSLSNLVKL